jgi:hypothetical protein
LGIILLLLLLLLVFNVNVEGGSHWGEGVGIDCVRCSSGLWLVCCFGLGIDTGLQLPCLVSFSNWSGLNGQDLFLKAVPVLLHTSAYETCRFFWLSDLVVTIVGIVWNCFWGSTLLKAGGIFVHASKSH